MLKCVHKCMSVFLQSISTMKLLNECMMHFKIKAYKMMIEEKTNHIKDSNNFEELRQTSCMNDKV